MPEPMDKVAELFQDASKEFEKEIIEKYKDEVKTKLAQKQQAQKLVNNIDRELKELELKIRQEIEAGG